MVRHTRLQLVVLLVLLVLVVVAVAGAEYRLAALERALVLRTSFGLSFSVEHHSADDAAHDADDSQAADDTASDRKADNRSRWNCASSCRVVLLGPVG